MYLLNRRLLNEKYGHDYKSLATDLGYEGCTTLKRNNVLEDDVFVCESKEIKDRFHNNKLKGCCIDVEACLFNILISGNTILKNDASRIIVAVMLKNYITKQLWSIEDIIKWIKDSEYITLQKEAVENSLNNYTKLFACDSDSNCWYLKLEELSQ